MTGYLLPGFCGLFLGLTLHWTGFHRPSGLRDTLALHRSYALRSGLYALGFAMAATALLCWLAVIDVDTIEVLPLSAGVLVGGACFGIATGLCGFTPGTAFAGLGSGSALTAICIMAGCLAGTWLLPTLQEPLTLLHAAPPQAAATLFQVTLDEPFLLDGGFLGQGCAGLLLMAIAICIPSPKLVPFEAPLQPEAPVVDAPEPDEAIPTESAADVSDPNESLSDLPEEILPEDAPADAFVALLPGEEPLVVDTVLDEPDPSQEADPSPAAIADADSSAPPVVPSEADSIAMLPEALSVEDIPDVDDPPDHFHLPDPDAASTPDEDDSSPDM